MTDTRAPRPFNLPKFLVLITLLSFWGGVIGYSLWPTPTISVLVCYDAQDHVTYADRGWVECRRVSIR